MAQDLKVTSGAEKRRRSTYLFKASDELTVRIRKIDFMTMMLKNLIPFPLLKAAQEYEKFQGQLGSDMNQSAGGEIDATERLSQVDPNLLLRYNEFLQHYASVVVVEPRIITGKLEEHGELKDGELHIDDISAEELLNILNASDPAEATVPQEGGLTLIKDQEASDFRGGVQPPDGAPTPDGEDVQPGPQLLDLRNREAIHA